jgi:hypothetical protein
VDPIEYESLVRINLLTDRPTFNHTLPAQRYAIMSQPARQTYFSFHSPLPYVTTNSQLLTAHPPLKEENLNDGEGICTELIVV